MNEKTREFGEQRARVLDLNVPVARMAIALLVVAVEHDLRHHRLYTHLARRREISCWQLLVDLGMAEVETFADGAVSTGMVGYTVTELGRAFVAFLRTLSAEVVGDQLLECLCEA